MEDGIKRLFAYLIAGGGTGSGTDGREVELRNSGEYIQWRYSGEEDWTNLVSLADLKGEKGDDYVLTDEDIEEIASKVKVETSADKITYDDTETQLGATNVQDAIGKVSEQILDLEENGTGGGSGLNTTAKNLLVAILREGLYVTDQSENITKLAVALSSGSEDSGGDSGEDTATYYTISNVLTNVTTSNSATVIEEGNSYTAQLTYEGEIDVTVTMNGEDITNTSYTDGTIYIGSVTGNVVITAKTVKYATIAQKGNYNWASTDSNGLFTYEGMTENAPTIYSFESNMAGGELEITWDTEKVVTLNCTVRCNKTDGTDAIAISGSYNADYSDECDMTNTAATVYWSKTKEYYDVNGTVMALSQPTIQNGISKITIPEGYVPIQIAFRRATSGTVSSNAEFATFCSDGSLQLVQKGGVVIE